MPTGLDATGGWVDAPTDLPGFGDIQWTGAGSGWGRAMTGGGLYPSSAMLVDPSQTGFERISTGESVGAPVPGPAGRKVTTWANLFNYKTNPAFWILVFALAAVGFIHARLSLGGSVGKARAGGGFSV